MTTPTSHPLSYDLFAGMAANVADALASHPVDQVKTQAHVNRGVNPSVVAMLHRQVQLGGLFSLYRGVLAAAVRPQSVAMYVGNEASQKLVVGVSGAALTTFTATLAGSLTGYVEAACVTPFEVVKVRMQALEHQSKYTSSLHCARTIVAEEGPVALYNGFWATCWRNCVFNGSFFGAIFWLRKQKIVRYSQPAGPAGRAFHDVAIGVLAGFFGTCIKMPCDVAKSRLQAQLGEVRYTDTLQCVARVAREEGVLALWKGLVPTSLRICLGQPVAYATFEAVLRVLRGDSR